MKLLDNESVLTTTSNNEITLTNYRIVKFAKLRGATNYASIFLNDISSVQFKSFENKNWLYAAGLVFLFGGFAASQSHNSARPFFGCCFISAILVGLYFFTRKQCFEIRGKGSEQIITITNETFETAFNFITATERQLYNHKNNFSQNVKQSA